MSGFLGFITYAAVLSITYILLARLVDYVFNKDYDIQEDDFWSIVQ